MSMFDHDFKKYPELTNSQMETLRFISPFPQIEEDFEATVLKVHDGDTVNLTSSVRDFSFPLRFQDIDAPELNAGGAVAGDWLRARILGRRVTVLIDKKNRVDKYGRLLGRIICDGLNVGEEMLRLGLVWPFNQRREGQLPHPEKRFAVAQWF